MRIEWIEWTEDRILHIARHGVEPDEVESVLFGRHRERRGREGSIVCYGRTASGRYLLVVIVERPDCGAFPVTARDMEDKERRMYRRTK